MVTPVRMAELQRRWSEVGERAKNSFNQVLNGGVYVGGPEVQGFESEFATYCGVAHCVGVGSGLDALTLGLRALGVGPKDKVIVPAYTFLATWLAVLSVGAEPVGVDVDSATGLINLSTASEKTIRDAAAILPVALYGAEPKLDDFAGAGTKLPHLIVDAAQSHGLPLSLNVVEAEAVLYAYSFYPTKNLGAIGDAGAVLTSNVSTAEAIREMRSYGSSQNDAYAYQRLGVNSRLDAVQAAFLRASLPYLDNWNSRRRDVASAYLDALGPAKNLVVAPKIRPVENSVWHQFAIRTIDRLRFREHLKRAGIESGTHYPYVAAYEAARLSQTLMERPSLGTYPGAEMLARTVTTLPVHPWLTISEVAKVCEVLRCASSDPALGLIAR